MQQSCAAANLDLTPEKSLSHGSATQPAQPSMHHLHPQDSVASLVRKRHDEMDGNVGGKMACRVGAVAGDEHSWLQFAS